MRDYGFDYLVEKVQVLNEMANVSEFWRTNFSDFENLYKTVQVEMAKHPKAPSGQTLTHRRLEYVTKSFFEFLSTKQLENIGINKNAGFSKSVKNLAIRELSPEERIGTRKTRTYTPEYANFAPKDENGMPKNADNAPLQQEFMLRLMVKAYKDEALSPQFAKKLLDQKNINKYGDDNFGTTKSSSSNFAYGMTTRKEKMFGMSMEEAYIIQNKAKSIIQKLRKSKKLPKGISLSIYSADKNFNQPDSISPEQQTVDTPLIIFKKTLEELMKYKSKLVQALRGKKDPKLSEEERGVNADTLENIKYERSLLLDTDISIFQKMLKNVDSSINSNQDISNEKIEKLILKLMGNASGVILKYYKRNFQTASYQDNEAELLKQERYKSVYDTLTDDVLDDLEEENIITSEESQLLAKWRNILSSLQQSIVSKSSRDDEKADEAQSREDRRMIRQGEYEKQGKKLEDDKKLKEKGVKKPKIDITDEVGGLSASEIEEKLREMRDVDNPDYEKIDAISKYLNKLSKDNPEDEEGVMGYMTEQVNKDRHLNNIGEYRDRGFKKPINHAHWLWLNQ